MKKYGVVGVLFAVICVIVLIGLALARNAKEVPMDDVIATGSANLVTENEPTENEPVVVNEVDPLFEKHFDVIRVEVERGNSNDSIKSDNPKEYGYFMSAGPGAFDFLMGQIKAEGITIRKKLAAEWLISDIIKLQSEVDAGEIRVEYWKAVTNKQCSGKIAADVSAADWSVLPANCVVQITGMLSMDWFTAKRIAPLKLDELSPDHFGTDEVEFWINREDLYFTTADLPLIFQNVNFTSAKEYTSIVKENVDEMYSIGLDQMVQQVGIYENPSAGSPILGYAFSNDLIRRIKDFENKDITIGEWVLVEKIPLYWDPSDTGWMRASDLVTLEAESMPNQGFILRHTKTYEAPELEKHEGVINESGIACVHITERRDGFIKVNAGLNSFVTWIKAEDVYYQMTPEIEEEIFFPVAHYDVFVEHLQQDIETNPLFTIQAEDNKKMIVLTEKEKKQLSNTLVSMGAGVPFPGGINEDREAAYPFYRLDFGTYSMVLTTKNQLLLQLDSATRYEYGIGREGASIQFVTPNIEFFEAVWELLPALPNNNEQSFEFLMNAVSLTIDGQVIQENGVIQQAQMNKVARGLRNSAGTELASTIVNETVMEKNVYGFSFEDGKTMQVTYTDQYIEFNGIYYMPLVGPSEFMASLFAAYF